MILNIKDYKYHPLIIGILFSDILHYIGLSIVTKFLFLVSFILIILSSKKRNFYIIFFSISFLYIFFYFGFLQGTQTFSYFIFPLLIIAGFLLANSDFNPEDFRKLILFFLIANAFVLIYEKFSGGYLFDYGHPYSLIQGQGLFAWTKVQGEFLIGIGLLFIRDRQMLFILLISSLLSGVRAASLLIVFLFGLSYLSSFKIKYKLNNKYLLPLILVSIYFLVPVFIKTFDSYNIGRYTSMLNLNSSTYSVRDYVHNMHLDCISKYTLEQFIFGKGEYCTKLYNWGAESTIIHSIEYYGIIFSLILFSSVILIYLKNLRWLNFQNLLILTVLIIYFWNWRFGFTYMGIFLWWYIYNLSNKHIYR